MEKKDIFAPLALGLGATRRTAMLLLVMLLTTATAWAQSGSCGDNLRWVLNGNTLTISAISGSGAMWDYDDGMNTAQWSSYAEQIQEVVIENGVTSIGNYAFFNCNYLGSVTFADGSQLESIGNDAFNGTTLTSIEIPASVTSIGDNTFFSCSELGSVTFAEGSKLESIGDNAFRLCSNLTSITIPASVTSIGSYVFQNCDLASITVADGNTVYDSRNGCNAIIVKATNTLIIGCKNSTIPTGVTSIGNHAFNSCTNLTSITIPASVTSIGMRAFGSTRLTSIEIPASVTSIGDYAFGYCHNLATVTVYAPSCTLGGFAFDGCDKLENIYVFSDLVDTYKAAENWSTYAGKITGITGGYCGTTDHERDVVWVLTGESPNYTLTISGTGAMADYASYSDQPWKDYRSSIKTVVIGAGVTSLGKYTFYGCTSLTSIEIPASVTSIGNYTFSKCSGLTSIEIPASVTSIGDNAFWDCSNLATVTFAEGSQLATIGISAFSKCSGLASVEIPAGVTSIGKYAFHYCSGLATVSFAAGSQLTSIGDFAFEYCSGLTSIEIPASMTSIGSSAFDGCSKLATVTFAEGSQLESIGVDAFNGCTDLTSITIPASVTSIGVSAFASCSNLEAMTVADGNTVYDSRNGCNAIIEKSSNTLIAGCKNTTIPDGVTSIRNYAFYKCTGLTSINIPAGVTNIGNYTFYGCTGLASINIPAGVTSIGMRAFYGCTGLTSIDIPSSVTSIGTYTFYGCTDLASIEIPAGVTSIDDYAFKNCSNLATVTVYAPSCSLGKNVFSECTKLENIYVFSDYGEYYQYAWSTYAGKITALPTVTTSYVDATGTLHEGVEAIPLNNVMTTLPAGTYVVNSDVAYTGTVTLDGDVTLILGDGKTMNVTTTGEEPEDYCINAPDGHSLHIYGQSGGTGWLKAYSAQNDGINNVYYTQYSGNVVIIDGNGACIYAREFTILGGTLDLKSEEGDANGEIVTTGDINIRGGKLWARNKGLKTMNGKIILGYTNATDEIYAYSYQPQNGLQIADGKTLVDDYGYIWSGTLDYQIEYGINNITLKPLVYSGVTLTGNGFNVSATFDGTSETTVSIPVDVTVNSVTLNRTFTDGKPSTVMLPFSLGEGQTLTGGTLYKFTGVTKNETTGMWEATMTETATLQANTPYLLMPNNELTDGKVTFDLNKSTVTLNTTGGGYCLAEGWEFHGTYEKKVWDEAETHDYGFAAVSGKSVDGQDVEAGQFVRLTTGASAKPMRCYLSYVGVPNQARALTRGAAATDEELPQRITVRLVGANGQTTGIGTIDNGQLTIDNYADADGWYDLQGRKLSGKPTKSGLYIKNGKKFVIK